MNTLDESANLAEKARPEPQEPPPARAATLLDELCGSRASSLETDGRSSAQSVPPTGIQDQMDGDNTPCWVARAVYGADNPRWMLFREWLLEDAPRWFRNLYIRHGMTFARWIAPHRSIKSVIRRWMDSRIDRN